MLLCFLHSVEHCATAGVQHAPAGSPGSCGGTPAGPRSGPRVRPSCPSPAETSAPQRSGRKGRSCPQSASRERSRGVLELKLGNGRSVVDSICNFEQLLKTVNDCRTHNSGKRSLRKAMDQAIDKREERSEEQTLVPQNCGSLGSVGSRMVDMSGCLIWCVLHLRTRPLVILATVRERRSRGR